MKSYISAFALLSTGTLNSVLVNADYCSGDDPLACMNLGMCRDGMKDYESLLGVSSVGHMHTTKRGMYCECPDDSANAKLGYSGLHCTTEFERCEDNSICFNEGFCERDSTSNTYHCACLTEEGFAGKHCESQPSTPEGYCSASENEVFYALAGYPWFCVNGGICQDNETNLGEKCLCETGFAGLHCEYLASEWEQCSLNCSGVGECKKGAKDLSLYIDYGLDVDEFLGGTNINGEHCICPEGYTGLNCEMKESLKQFKHCGSGVCFNDAVCVEVIDMSGQTKDFHCECNELDAGKFCEHDGVEFCPFPENHDPTMYYCANGGDCPLGEPHEPCTNCDSGWTGPRCEIKVEHEEQYNERSVCDLDCQNGGKCFFGDHPLEDGTLSAIPGLEFLQDNKHCRCPAGYIGLRCEMRYQQCGEGEHYCLHGSSCVPDNDEFTCDCNEVSTSIVAYAGHYCEHTATEFCAGPGGGKHSFCTEHGTCRGAVGLGKDHVGCTCEIEWTGEYCEYHDSQLQTNGIATRAFVGFVIVLLLSILISSLAFCCCKKNNKNSVYESAAFSETHANPYGDINNDEEENEEYEFKEVTII